MCGLSTVVTPVGASLTMYREIRSYANSIWDDNNNKGIVVLRFRVVYLIRSLWCCNCKKGTRVLFIKQVVYFKHLILEISHSLPRYFLSFITHNVVSYSTINTTY